MSGAGIVIEAGGRGGGADVLPLRLPALPGDLHPSDPGWQDHAAAGMQELRAAADDGGEVGGMTTVLSIMMLVIILNVGAVLLREALSSILIIGIIMSVRTVLPDVQRFPLEQRVAADAAGQFLIPG